MAEPLNDVVIHCKGLLFDDAGRLLLVQQGESFGTFWKAPGGRMDDGDSLESCLEREIREETGLIVESAQLAYSHTFVSPGVTDIRFVLRDDQLPDPLFPRRLWDVAEECHRDGFIGVQ